MPGMRRGAGAGGGAAAAVVTAPTFPLEPSFSRLIISASAPVDPGGLWRELEEGGGRGEPVGGGGRLLGFSSLGSFSFELGIHWTRGRPGTVWVIGNRSWNPEDVVDTFLSAEL
jgi:hypothetical protein